MIILEGPDGAGKSTLIQRLSEDLDLPVAKRACTSTGGPVDNLGHWAAGDVMGWGKFPISLYDRHPFISEYIYGPVIRGHIDPTMERLHPSYRWRFMAESLVVLCMPPLDVVKANLAAEQQMDGVTNHIELIYALYAAYGSMAPVIRYDYTQPNSYFRLHHKLLNHLKEKSA